VIPFRKGDEKEKFLPSLTGLAWQR